MAQTNPQWLTHALRAIDERRWLRHGLFWLVRTVVLTWLVTYIIHVAVNVRLGLRDMLLLLVPHMLATYALLYGVLPALWQGRRTRFLLLLAGWALLSLTLHHAFRYFVLVPRYVGLKTPISDAHNALSPGPFIVLLITAGVAACLRVYRQWRQKELDNAQLTHDNYQAELQLLKAQIHPHFLFNTLNNLYALTLRQADQAPEVVARLTGLLQFVVEQGDAPLVTLRDEVALLRNYMALEQLRYGPRLTLEFRADDLPATAQIAPLLLLPLVENAFKHGSAEQVGRAHISVVLAVEAGHRFTCVIINTKNDTAAEPTQSGIGLRNVRQRLELLYPQRHRFETEARADTYIVRLTLQLPGGEMADAPPAAPLRQLAAAGQPAVSEFSQSIAHPHHA
ncbi:sensor histidine kinase [Hymenobacter terricola]|uniref:sensor histidine kinase n=1 Tax=Hymenobacter terricola TaxID=2819236 RepID=UPI001B307956|nr:histidine kinase [Hymenobacter terricola]